MTGEPAERPILKIHGAFRSGTNLLKAMVERNFGCECLMYEGGHKHLPVPLDYHGDFSKPPYDMLIACKNPFALLSSMFRYARHVRFRHFVCGRDWDGFLRGRFVIRFLGDMELPAYRFSDPVDYFNSLYFNLTSIPSSRRVIVQYERMLADPAAVLADIGRTFPSIPANMDGPELPREEILRMGEHHVGSPLTSVPFERAGFYERHDYMREYSREQRVFVWSRLDREVLTALGYESAPVLD